VDEWGKDHFNEDLYLFQDKELLILSSFESDSDRFIDAVALFSSQTPAAVDKEI
jgi:hypothetical protein